MTEVISVRFKNKGKLYFFDPAGNVIPSDVSVIVETSKGLEFAYCTWGNHWVDDALIVPPLRPAVRIATEADIKRSKDNKEKEAEAFRICQEKILKHEIDMKLVDVEYNFEGTKILFFFTSDGRVDFRELVKDLASVFRTRIELRQIGVRDEAKMLGGLGICGKPFCCSQFLDEFHPVSIKMAKTQGLSLNPTKISGTCGRLMCCLKYEQVAYEDIVRRAPKVDSFVETPGGKGSVINVNLLRGYAKVRLEDSGDTTLKAYPFEEIEVLGGKSRRAEYLTARSEGRLEEAGFKPSHIRESKPVRTEAPSEEEAPFVFADGTVADNSPTQQQAESNAQRQKNRRGNKPPQKRPPQKKPRPQTASAPSKDANKEQQSQNQQRKRPNQPKPPAQRDAQRPRKPKAQDDVAAASQKSEVQATPVQDGAAPAEKKRSHYYRNRKRKPGKPESSAHKDSSPQ